MNKSKRRYSPPSVTITKDILIDAMEEESIGLYNHFDIDSPSAQYMKAYGIYYEKMIAPNCTVCAVGAVMRTAGISYRLGFRLVGEGSSMHSQAAAGNYLSAMSILYEYVVHSNPLITVPELRETMIDWIEANVPEKWSITTITGRD